MGNTFSKKDTDNKQKDDKISNKKIDFIGSKNKFCLKKERSNSWPSEQLMTTDVRQDLDSIFFY